MAQIETINIFLTAIISLLGFPTGIVLSKLAKEELKSAKKYINSISKIIEIILIILLSYLIPISILYQIITALILSTISWTIRKKENLIGIIVIPILFIMSINSISILFLSSSIIFIYLTSIGIKKQCKKKIL